MPQMKQLTVLGTGVLGSQIIMQAAYAGKTVVGYDITDDILAKLPARWEWMRGHYRRDVAGFSDDEFDAAIARITPTTSMADAMAHADIVIESVPEKLELKHEVWRQLGRVDPGHAVLATNSSYLLPSEIAPAVSRPNRFGALHFANMVWRANNGEVMGHAGTDPDALDAIAQFAEQINLRVFRVHKENRGYLLNAQLVPLLKEAGKLYAGGIGGVEEINESLRLALGLPVGMMDVFDIVGFKVAYEICSVDEDPVVREFGRVMKVGIDNGKTGIGDGEGFYTYDRKGSKTGLSPQFPALWKK